MVQQFLLPCECGLANPVAAAQAGRTLACSCGRQQRVPPLRALRQLEPAQPTDAPLRTQRRPGLGTWPIRVGLLAILLATSAGVWYWRGLPPTPEMPEINLV